MNKKVISVVLLAVIAFSSYVIFKNKDAVFVLSENIKQIFEDKKQEKGGTTIVSALRPQFTKGDLIQKSDIIVIGRVKSVEVKEVPSYIRKGKSDIVRDYSVLTERYIKDRYNLSKPDIIVRELGGTFGGKTMIVEDSVEYQIGDKVLFFLIRLEDNIFGLVSGGPEAKYVVSQTDNIGVKEDEKNHLKRMFGKDQFKLNNFIDEIKKIEEKIK